MALEGDVNLKNAKKLLDEKGEKITLLWVPGNMGIPENEAANKEAKTALENILLPTEKYPPQDLINWIKTEVIKIRKTKW
jgi:ribonuclease HI